MYTDINSEEYREQFASEDSGAYQLIDVRDEDEYAAGHIPGTINIPLSELPARFDELSEDSPVLLVCNTGVRSSQAAAFPGGHGLRRFVQPGRRHQGLAEERLRGRKRG